MAKEKKYLSIKDTTISFLDFVKMFSTEHKAREYLMKIRWGNKIFCPYCGHEIVYSCNRKKEHGFYECGKCNKVFSVRTGTIFERSHIPLTKWLYACYKVITARKGISSVQLGVEIGVTQKTSWFMLQRIRNSCSGFDLQKLREIVEVDGAYFGGSEKCKHKSKKQNLGRGAVGKICVLGMKQRGKHGKVKAVVIKATDHSVVYPTMENHIEKDAHIMTDEAKVYERIPFEKHSIVKHHDLEFVKDNAYTNEIEFVWAIMKRGWKGVYHHFSPKHLQLYVNEYCFRMNEGRCDLKLEDRIKSICGFGIKGKHMTFKELLSREGDNGLKRAA